MRSQRVAIHLLKRTGRAAGLLLAAGAAFLCVSLPSGKGASGQDFHACAPDVKALCKGVKPGGGRVSMCLTQHEANLSPACKPVVAAIEANVKEVGQACADDVHMFCSEIPAGSGRIAECLREHQQQVSPACKTSIRRAVKHPAQR